MFIAVRTGLEPATPGVTGPYSNQLNYRTSMSIFLVSTVVLKLFSSTVSLIADAKIRKISLPPNFSSFFCTSSSLQVPVTSGGPESKKKGWNTHLFPSLLQLNCGKIYSAGLLSTSAKDRFPLQHSFPFTLRLASVKNIIPRRPVSFAVISHVSPGRTMFLNLTLSIPL